MRFSLELDRPGKDGARQVLLVLVRYGRARLRTGILVHQKDWDSKRGRLKFNARNAGVVNARLEKLVTEAEAIAIEQPELDPHGVKALLEKPKAAGLLLHQAAAHVLKARASRFEASTVDRLGILVRWIGEALPNASLQGLSPADVHRFREYVHARGVGQNTLRSRLKQLRILYRHACSEYGVTPRDLFGGMLPQELPAEPRFLRPAEIEALERWEGQGSEAVARDAFLLALYLGGMRFADLAGLSPSQIVGGDLRLRQGKTGAFVSLPIIPKAAAIIERYKGQAKVLPLSTNQQVNEALKRVAYACGVNPKVSMHWARHGFAAWATRSGVNVQTISAILGHSSVVTTQKYLSRFDRAAVDEAMRKIFG